MKADDRIRNEPFMLFGVKSIKHRRNSYIKAAILDILNNSIIGMEDQNVAADQIAYNSDRDHNGFAIRRFSTRIALNQEHQRHQQAADLVEDYDPLVFYFLLFWNLLLWVPTIVIVGVSANKNYELNVFIFVCIYAGLFTIKIGLNIYNHFNFSHRLVVKLLISILNIVLFGNFIYGQAFFHINCVSKVFTYGTNSTETYAPLWGMALTIIIIEYIRILFTCLLCLFLLWFPLSQLYRNFRALKGADAKQLAKIKVRVFQEGDKDDKCIICFDRYAVGDQLRVLPCSDLHEFHKDCVDEWLKLNRICPLCRQDITDKLNGAGEGANV